VKKSEICCTKWALHDYLCARSPKIVKLIMTITDLIRLLFLLQDKQTKIKWSREHLNSSLSFRTGRAITYTKNKCHWWLHVTWKSRKKKCINDLWEYSMVYLWSKSNWYSRSHDMEANLKSHEFSMYIHTNVCVEINNMYIYIYIYKMNLVSIEYHFVKGSFWSLLSSAFSSFQ